MLRYQQATVYTRGYTGKPVRLFDGPLTPPTSTSSSAQYQKLDIPVEDPPAPITLPKGAKKVSSLIQIWAQRDEDEQPAIKKPIQLPGTRHLPKNHVQASIAKLTAPPEPARVPKSIVQQRIATFTQLSASEKTKARNACLFAIERKSKVEKATKDGIEPLMLYRNGPLMPNPSPLMLGDTRPLMPRKTEPLMLSSGPLMPSGTEPRVPDSTEPLMLDSTGPLILGSTSSQQTIRRHFLPSISASIVSEEGTRSSADDQAPTISAAALAGPGSDALFREIESMPIMKTGTAKILGTRRYRRGTLDTEGEMVRVAVRVPQRLVSDINWLRDGVKSSHRPTVALPIARQFLPADADAADTSVYPSLHLPKTRRRTPPATIQQWMDEEWPAGLRLSSH
ncbi:hypothetical protein ABW20_dc0107661 [Dactylellina cionopaga]|nr:hypothetical protein ABW20_dc0107661 [Dactylellina cionopaga]